MEIEDVLVKLFETVLENQGLEERQVVINIVMFLDKLGEPGLELVGLNHVLYCLGRYTIDLAASNQGRNVIRTRLVLLALKPRDELPKSRPLLQQSVALKEDLG